MNSCPLLRKPQPLIALVILVAVSLLSCLASAPVADTLWYEMTCDGLGLLGDGFLIEALGIEYHAPRRGFSIEDLLLGESVLPEGWEAGGKPFDPQDGLPAEQIAVTFFRHRCPDYSLVASHDAYRFLSGTRCAEMAYRRKSRVWFALREGWGAWEVPAALPYQSPVADEFRFNCYNREDGGAQSCQALGRYDEYIVRFRATMSSQCMTFTDLERVLIAIDERMAGCLGKDTQ